MKILIVNLHSSRNAGDDLLTQITVQQLQESFPQVSLTLAMNDPDSYEGAGQTVGSFITWVRRQADELALKHYLLFALIVLETCLLAFAYRLLGLSALKLAPVKHRPLLSAYFTADLVISGAGNYLYTSGRIGLTFVIAIYTMAYAWLCAKPLYSMPQTIGPLVRSWEQGLVRWIANRARMLFVRDAISKEELEKMKLRHNRHLLMPDLAFAYPKCAQDAGIQLLQKCGITYPSSRPLLGVTMMNWAAQTPTFEKQAMYETAVAAAIRLFVTNYNGQAILFSQVCGPTFIEDDRVPAGKVKELLPDLGDAVLFIEQETPTDVLKSAYGLMDIFIGTRLHSNIFAVSEGIPAIMIEYRYKTRGVMRMLALEDWIVSIDGLETAVLTAKLQQLWQQRQQVRQHIQTHMPAIVAQASQVGQCIAEDFAQNFGEKENHESN